MHTYLITVRKEVAKGIIFTAEYRTTDDAVMANVAACQKRLRAGEIIGYTVARIDNGNIVATS